jgi:hypothetical protein
VQIHCLVGQAGKPVKAKGRAGCPPHNKLSLQKWDAPCRILAVLTIYAISLRRSWAIGEIDTLPSLREANQFFLVD